MRRAFTTLAERIEQRDLAGAIAMGGPGGQIDTPIYAFFSAVNLLDAEFPGKSIKLPR